MVDVLAMSSSEHICETATRLFARQGYDGTSIQSIAEAVGITKQSLLYHYESKEALRGAVLEKLFDHWRDTLPQLLEAVTSGQARFDLLTEELISFFRSDPDRARLVVRELLDRPEEMRRLMGENLRPWLLLIGQYIRQGQQSGVLRADIDAESYVLHVINLVVAAIANFPVLSAALPAQNGSLEHEERHLHELLRLVRRGLFKDATEEEK